MPKSLIYCRVSSDRQVKEGHGLDGQELRCRAYSRERGYEVAQVFRDEGVSGGVIDREGMQQMLDFLDAHGPREEFVVVIDDIKRLARDLLGHFTLRKAIQSRGARLESPSHKFGNEPEEIFVESIFAATAELERNQNRKQVCNRMKARLEAGYWPFYPPPGYTFAKVAGHGKLLVRKDPEASIIQEALEGFATGRFAAPVDIQRFLQYKGFKHRGEGRVTYLEQVHRLLTREVYAGFVVYSHWNVTRRKAHHEALVSPETFDQIQDRLRAHRPKVPQRQDADKDFPLRGFLLCGACGHPYTAGWTKGRNRAFPYYRCKSLGCPFRNKSVRADLLHKEFEGMLARLKPRPNIMEIVRNELLDKWQEKKWDVETVRKERHRKLDAIQKEIDKYLDAVSRCHNPTMLKKIEEEVDALEAKRLRLGGEIERPKKGEYDFETALNRVLDFIKDPLSMWNSGDIAKRRLVLRLVFSEPLAYRKDKGWATACFSLPINICCVTELDELEVVDLVRKSLNRLETLVREWSEAIAGLSGATNAESPA